MGSLYTMAEGSCLETCGCDQGCCGWWAEGSLGREEQDCLGILPLADRESLLTVAALMAAVGSGRYY